MNNMLKIMVNTFFLIFMVFSNLFAFTDAEVINIVKNFENNQNLTNLSVEYYGDQHIYNIANSDGQIEWEINDAGSVTYYTNYNEINSDRKEEGGAYSKAQCSSIALSYLNSKGISLIGYETTPDISWDKAGGYPIFYYKYLNTTFELRSNNYLVVSVNSNSGNIIRFRVNTKSDPIISNLPTLTDSEVTNIINQLYGASNVSDLKIGGYGYEDDYNTIVRIADVNNYAWVYIDAYNHNVLKITYFQGTSLSTTMARNVSDNMKKYNVANNKKKFTLELKPYKPLSDEELATLTPTVKDINFILLKTENKKNIKYFDIKKKDKRVSLEEADKNIVYLNIKDKKIIFNNGSNFAFVNNKTNNMGGNFIIENNKIKIPLDFAKEIELTK